MEKFKILKKNRPHDRQKKQHVGKCTYKIMVKYSINNRMKQHIQLHAHKRLNKANPALTESAHKNMFATFTKLMSRQLSASFTLTCEFGVTVALPFTTCMCTSTFTLK